MSALNSIFHDFFFYVRRTSKNNAVTMSKNFTKNAHYIKTTPPVV